MSADVLKKYTPATETISTTHGLQVASDIAPPPYSAGNFRTRNITSTEYLSPPPYRKTAPAYDNTGITIAPITTPGKAKKNRPPSYWESQNIHRPKNSNATPVQTIAHQSNDSFEPIQRLSPDTIRRNRDFLRRHVISGRRWSKLCPSPPINAPLIKSLKLSLFEKALIWTGKCFLTAN